MCALVNSPFVDQPHAFVAVVWAPWSFPRRKTSGQVNLDLVLSGARTLASILHPLSLLIITMFITIITNHYYHY